ncbi:zinc finger protein 518A [Morone saxatilis]|uniref:zinc finger protein 518A n=1 Tax=Morone saxatilis TaxID=34816 RepID=UPI0015E1BB45|nr:zinc finger protein 518A [Morone saxatilis]XP_035519906.1 zinc finger protein 518A [Morone saxatilis]
MDSVDIGAVTSTGGNKRRVNKKNRDWHKRLHLRKTAVQPPTMQSEDKRGPKKITEEWEQSAVWPSSKKPPQEAQQRTNDSGNTLRFTCSQCMDNLEYVHRDLVRHFEEKHRGSPPVFSCHMCTFSTHEFSYLQVHLLSHKDTFSSCSVCNDNVQRTWPEFSAHLTMCHCQNGKYSCEMCPKFSTGDIRVFLGHMYAHNLGLDEASDEPKTTTQALRCQHCGYEASHKLLITKHIKAAHVCQNGNQRKKKKKEVHSIAMKPSDPIPKIKPRLTRSAVREMCWLTQDCLSLPGREFLDKYCHLSDPQTTLEETQQFLMKSVAGETGDQKWTKALKTVLTNVPQDMNLHPKSENGIMSNSSDLTVLTVKNKITVAQNGATYPKKLKMMTSSDKETVSPESAADDAHCVVDQNGCQSNLNDHTPCPQTETKLTNDVSMPAQSEPSECAQMQENRENQELQTDQKVEEHGQRNEEPMHEDGVKLSSELKLTNDSEEPTSVHKVVPKNKRRNRRRKRKARSKRVNKISAGLALKIVLKKNPVKEKQWVSQSSVSPSGGGPTDDGLPIPRTTLEETALILQNEMNQQKWTKASKPDPHDPSEAITSILRSKPREELTPSCAAKPMGSKNIEGNSAVTLEGSLSTHQEMQDEVEKSLQFLETKADVSGSAGRAGQSNLRDAAVTEVEVVCPESARLQTSGSGRGHYVLDNKMSTASDGVTPRSSYTKSSPASQRVITPQDEINSEDVSLALSLEQSVEGMREVPADSCPDLLSNTNLPAGKAIQQEPSPASGHQWQLVPKNRERTLKLVAINPSQLVKRPAGDQPVVVLNHPDADIPEVARIMEVVNRYRGEVQKVVLSWRTVNALSAMNSKLPKTDDPTDARPDSARHGKNSVQERFMLKLKLRRLSRKKYEVVGVASPSRDAAATKFRCWFCGRVFASQETWMVHRQRHLMEWKRPNCENS